MDLIRRLAERGPVRGIAISGYGTDDDVARSKAAGFAEHVTKPFDFKQLDAMIQRLAGEEAPAPEGRSRS
jgi:CheY-like chemotaxis protein